MTIDRNLVIVGASLAGAKAAEAARATGFDGRVILIGDENELPYERPPLSKAVLRGEAVPESAHVHDDGFYTEHDIELLTGRSVETIDPTAMRIRLDGDEELSFTSAVLATGAAPRRLDVPGAGLPGVHYLRSMDDARRLTDAIGNAGRVAVIGAGWIGSEVAASARQMNAEVVLIDPAPVPLHRVLGDEIGDVFRGLHADHGVQLRLNNGVTELRGTNTVQDLVLHDGTVETADVVVVGVGVTPRVELAEHAGLKVDNGIAVDEHLQTTAPGIFAAGDVAAAWHPHYQQHLRVEHWSNALNQGLMAGANAVGSIDTYSRLPYFFSDQYELGMEYVGHSQPDDTVVTRGELASREFIAFWQRNGIVTAAMNVNVWDVLDDLKTIVASGLVVDADALADPETSLTEVASR